MVLAAAGLEESVRGALLRREGLQAAKLAAWRQAAETALDAPGRRAQRGRPAVNVSAPSPWWPGFRCPLVAGFGCPPRGDLAGRGRSHAAEARAHMMIALIDAAVL